MTNDQKPTPQDPAKVAPQVRPHVINSLNRSLPSGQRANRSRKNSYDNPLRKTITERRPEVNSFQKNRETLVPCNRRLPYRLWTGLFVPQNTRVNEQIARPEKRMIGSEAFGCGGGFEAAFARRIERPVGGELNAASPRVGGGLVRQLLDEFAEQINRALSADDPAAEQNGAAASGHQIAHRQKHFVAGAAALERALGGRVKAGQHHLVEPGERKLQPIGGGAAELSPIPHHRRPAERLLVAVAAVGQNREPVHRRRKDGRRSRQLF